MTIEQIRAEWKRLKRMVGITAVKADFADRHFDILLMEIDLLKQWVHDCQSNMYINCVYCGYRYRPHDKVPATMAQVLKDHIERCKKHSMYEAKQEISRLRLRIRNFECQNHRESCSNGWWVTPHTCSCGFQIVLVEYQGSASEDTSTIDSPCLANRADELDDSEDRSANETEQR